MRGKKEELREKRDKVRKEMVSKYQLGEMIGKGGIGCVLKGLDTESGETVAIKQVRLNHLKKGRLE